MHIYLHANSVVHPVTSSASHSSHTCRFCRQGCSFLSTVPHLRGRFCTGRCVNSPLYCSWPSPSSHISTGGHRGNILQIPGVHGGGSHKPRRTQELDGLRVDRRGTQHTSRGGDFSLVLVPGGRRTREPERATFCRMEAGNPLGCHRWEPCIVEQASQ